MAVIANTLVTPLKKCFVVCPLLLALVAFRSTQLNASFQLPAKCSTKRHEGTIHPIATALLPVTPPCPPHVQLSLQSRPKYHINVPISYSLL
jgi:hypothetical protein